RLEALHRPTPGAVEKIWPYLGHTDRAIRFAARTALEHQDHLQWVDRAIAEQDPTAAIYALLALVRSAADCPYHRDDGGPPPDADLAAVILEALERIDYTKLPYERKLDLVRIYHVLFNRFGAPSDSGRERTIARFDGAY